MISSTFGKIDGCDIGKHPLIVRLMRGAYNKKPPVPKYSGFRDVNKAVDYLISLGPNSGLSFQDLSKKLAVLLALSSLCRVSELASVDRDSIMIDEGQAKFSLSKPRKTHTNQEKRNYPLQIITLKKASPAPSRARWRH